MCLVALATTDKLGYNYQPVGHSDSGLSFSPGSSGLGGGSSGGLGVLSGGSSAELGGPSGNLGGSLSGLGSGLSGGLNDAASSGLDGYGGLSGGSSGGLGSFGGTLRGLGGLVGGFGGLSGDSSGNIGGLGGSSSGSLDNLGTPGGNNDYSGSSGPSSSSAGAPSAVEYEKEFFTYSADDNDFDEPEANNQVSHGAKKNLRVIFIKGPENNALEKAAINLARQALEQRTAIYVLQKQASLGDLTNKLQTSHDVQSHQPEVHFVKYRTPEDAANAQKAIQAQYDQLDGPSQAHDCGVVPVHNFASPATHSGPSGVDGGIFGPASGVSGGNGQIGGISGAPGRGAPSVTYLPAAILRTHRV